MDELIHLFVYGSLKPGRALHGRIESLVRSVVPGEIDGVLINVGAFPALASGDGIVRGVLLLIETAALEITDQIEGYAPGRAHNFYSRKKTTVRLDDGGETEAWVYEYGDPERIADCPRLVVGSRAGRDVYEWRPDRDSP